MGSSSTQTTTQDLAPEAREIFGMMTSRYTPDGTLPNAPQWSDSQVLNAGGRRVAPLSDGQNQAISIANQYAAGSGSADYVDAASQYAQPRTDFATGVFGGDFTTANYNPNLAVGSYTAGNFGTPGFGTNSVNLNDTSGNSVVGQYNVGEISRFQNPYNELVMNRGLDRLNEQAGIGYNMLNANAYGAGAFGGDRHGIAEAEYMGNVNQNAGDFIAQQLQAGFQNAQQARLAEAGLSFSDQAADLQGEQARIGALNSAEQMNTGAQNQAIQYGNQVAQQGMADQNNWQQLMNAAIGQQVAADNNQLAQINAAQGQGMQNYLTLGAANQENVQNMLQMLTQTGQIDRDYGQAVRNMGFTALQQDYQYPLALAQAMAGFAPPPSTTTTAPNNIMSSIIPAIGSLGAAFLSDERAKEDVGEPSGVDEALEFLEDYNERRKSWSYKGSDERRSGPMAQDLEDAGHEDAVVDVGGMKGIDPQKGFDALMVAVGTLSKDVARLKRRVKA